MINAFSRRSMLEPSNYGGQDLGFWGVEPGEEQMTTHNRAIITIQIALLYQTLENYLTIKKINPKLEDSSLEDFLNSFPSRKKFVDGMNSVRKGVFHIKSTKAWRSRKVVSFLDTCDKRGGTLTVMAKLIGLLYDFTEKVFLGRVKDLA